VIGRALAGTGGPDRWGYHLAMKWLDDSPTRLVAVLFALLVLIAAALWKFAQWVAPPLPRKVVMSTGTTDGAYHEFALRYQSELARHGVKLVLRPSKGAVENLARLEKRDGGVMLALVQGGLSNGDKSPGIVTLGSMFYEPLWIFYRGDMAITQDNGLRGKRIAIGVPGSGTRAVALQVAALTGLDKPPTVLVDVGGAAAAAALEAGELDAAFFVYAPEAPVVKRLLSAPGIRLFEPTHIEAYSRWLPFLHAVTLYAGVVDLQRRLPASDVRLLALTADLLAGQEIHPALVDMLLEAARDVHGGRSLLSDVGQFPAPRNNDFPLSLDAERNYKVGPPALRRYVPLWAAVWIERTVFFLVPLLAIGIPLLHYVPLLWRWRMRRNVYRWYRELNVIERAARRHEGDATQHLARLDAMLDRLDRVWVPLGFTGELYALRAHVRMVASMLRRGDPQSAVGDHDADTEAGA